MKHTSILWRQWWKKPHIIWRSVSFFRFSFFVCFLLWRPTAEITTVFSSSSVCHLCSRIRIMWDLYKICSKTRTQVYKFICNCIKLKQQRLHPNHSLSLHARMELFGFQNYTQKKHLRPEVERAREREEKCLTEIHFLQFSSDKIK